MPSSRSLAAGLLSFPFSALAGQLVVPTVDIGGSRVRHADSLSSSALAISPAVRAEWNRATLAAGGTWSQFAGGWSSQGGVNGSVYLPLAGAVTGELGGALGGSAHVDGARTGQAQVLARAHLMAATRGAWAGAGVGTNWDGVAWRPVRTGELAAWLRPGAATMLASVTPTLVADTIRYADAELATRWELARAELGITGGVRIGDRLPTLGGAASAWGNVNAIAWLTSRAAVVLGGGTYPVDFTQGYPGGRFVSLALRVGPRASARFGRDGTRRVATDVAPATEPTLRGNAERMEGGIESFQAAAAGAGRLVVRVKAPSVTSVELTGDFSGWEPVRLVPAGAGWWSTTIAVTAGTYETNVRTDGGKWVVPPGLSAVRDEFGGSVGLLVVP